LPILHRAILRHHIAASSRQEIIGRIGYHTNVAYDCYRGLCPDRIGLGTTLDGSIRAGDSIVACRRWNTHERNRRFGGGLFAQIDILPSADREYDRRLGLLDHLYDLIEGGLI